MTFWTIVAGVLLTVVVFNPFPLPLYKAIATAITACMHFYFLQELERQEQGRVAARLVHMD